jgi:putative ABC transport system substrate-binding protein
MGGWSGPRSRLKVIDGEQQASRPANSTSLENPSRRIVELAAMHRLPAMYNARESVQVGGLIVYGASLAVLSRRAATYVDKILKGEKPADLPVELPTSFELTINLKTARVLGLDVPLFLQQRADE